MSQKYGDFYVLSGVDRPAYRNKCLLLDANAVSAISDWAEKVSKIEKSKIQPLLELIRNPNFEVIEPFWGAIETNWSLKRGEHLNSSNFRDVNLRGFKDSILTIETVRFASKDKFNEWLNLDRKGSIEYANLDETRVAKINLNSEDLSDLTSLVVPEWIAFITLLKALKEIDAQDSPELRLEKFMEWKSYLWKLQIPWRGFITYSAILGFFGGTLQHTYWDAKTEATLTKGKFSASEILKRDQWEIEGIARISRNLAFDSLLFFERNRLESGMEQIPGTLKIRRTKGTATAIVSGDKMVSALNSRFMATVKNSMGLDGSILQIPSDSLIYSMDNWEQVLRQISDKTIRSPESLPQYDELVPLLMALINQS